MEENQIIISEEYGNAEEMIQDGTNDNMGINEADAPAIEATESADIIPDTNDMTTHNNLHGRDVDDAHPIDAITGLRQKLDSLNTKRTQQTLYSDKYGTADYYEWDGGHRYDNFGYFVSMAPQSNKIQICNGTDVFGVTVALDGVGFVGGYDKDKYNEENRTYDNSYALVATSGFVDVRCETGVAVGNYVVPNDIGMAKVSTLGYGYKVVATGEWGDDPYATIAFNIPVDQIASLGANVHTLNGRMSDAEARITATMIKATQALAMAEEAKESSDDSSNKTDGIVDNLNEIISDFENTLNGLDEEIAEQIGQTESKLNQVIADANDKWAEKADELSVEIDENATYAMGLFEQNAGEISSLVASIDKYSVGEYSQSYNLSLSQAQAILKEGMIYIPTPHNITEDTHLESYKVGIPSLSPDIPLEGVFTWEFTAGSYYVWKPKEDGYNITAQYERKDGEQTITETISFNIDGPWWTEREDGVVVDCEMVPSGISDGYWYTYGEVTEELKEGGYESYTLYAWQDAKIDEVSGNEIPARWVKVNTLSGNINNRLINTVLFAPNGFGMSIANTRESVVSIQGELTETNVRLDDMVKWQEDTSEHVATIQRQADANSASVSQMVYNIVGYVKLDEPWNEINKDINEIYYVVANKEYWYYSKGEDLEEGSWHNETDATKVPGLEINAASIVAAINGSDTEVKIDAKHVIVDGSQIDLKGKIINLTADDVTITSEDFIVDQTGNMTANSGHIGGWSIDNHNIYNDNVKLSTAGIEALSLISGTSPCVVSAGGIYKTITHESGQMDMVSVSGFTYSFDVGESEITNVWLDENIRSQGNGQVLMDEFLVNGSQVTISAHIEYYDDEYPYDTDNVYLIIVCEIDKCTFRLLDDGSLYAKAADIAGPIHTISGEIGGWSIDDNSIYNKDIVLSTAGVENPSLMTGASPCFLSAGGTYEVYEGQHLVRQLMVQTIKGETEVDIEYTFDDGVYQIEDVWLVDLEENSLPIFTRNDGLISLVQCQINGSQVILTLNVRYEDVQNGDLDEADFYIKYKTSGVPNFRLLEDGSLYANAANISGNIFVNQGRIGRWELNFDSLKTGIPGNHDSFMLSATGEKIDSGLSFFNANTSWAMTIGKGFGVSTSGDIYAKRVYVEDIFWTGDCSYKTGQITKVGKIEKSNWSFLANVQPQGSYFSASFGVDNGGNIYADNMLRISSYSDSDDLSVKLSYQQLSFESEGNGVGWITLYKNQLDAVSIEGSWSLQGTLAVDGGSIVNSDGDSVSFSDKNLKNSIAPFSEKYDVFFDNLTPSVFKYNKGTSGRIHAGFIAQGVKGALEMANLSTQEFAGYVDCKGLGLDYLGLRYTEFISLNTWQIQKLKPRVAILEEKVQALEAENIELKEQIRQLLN